MSDAEPTLLYEFKNTRPIELLDFTASFYALAEQYRSFIARHDKAHVDDDVRLYIREVRTGSIVAELVSYAAQTQWLAPAAPFIASYVNELGEWFEFFKGIKDAADIKDLLLGTSKKDLQQIGQIIEPTAKDAGSIFTVVAKDSASVVVNHISMNSLEANAGQQKLRRIIDAQPVPISGIHPDQVLYWYQIRDDKAQKPGDLAVIEKFSPRPVKVRFASDVVKSALIDGPNPFNMLFVVDVDVSTVEGKPVLYRILEVKDSMDR